MGAFISKQPNGLLCRFSSVVDCPTHWNMTEDDYIDMCVQRSREEARYTLDNELFVPFTKVVNRFRPENMTEEEFKQFLHDVGYEKEK